MSKLRTFNEVHIDEDCTQLKGSHDNCLFFNCEFKNLRGVTLRNCDLNKSRFLTDSVKDALDFTLTLNCHSFKDVEFSPLLIDLLLTLIVMSKGNDEKREQLKKVIGDSKLEAIMKVLE